MKTHLAAAVLLLLAPLAAAQEKSPQGRPAAAYPRSELLVETTWLDENMIRPEIVVVDVRPRELYEQSHIPGSFWLDQAKLVKRDGEPPFVPTAAEFKALMESVGVGDGSHVIAVDESGGKSASRLWWALGYYGFDKVGILHGGFQKWEVEGRAQTVEYPYMRQATFTAKPRPERAATADQVKAWKSRPGGVILDARTPEEFSGERGRARRRGHIPGAVNIHFEENLTRGENFRLFKPAADLLQIYRTAGVTKDSQVVAYDQDGSRATHLLFTMALIGLSPDGANYVGGWGEWGNRTDLPVEGTPPSKPSPPAKAKSKS